MASKNNKKSNTKKYNNKIKSNKTVNYRRIKIACILASVLVVSCFVGMGIYRLYFDNLARNKDISFDSLRQGGAVIYDSESLECTALDLGKCGRWIPVDTLWSDLKNIDDVTEKGYAELIAEQFFDGAKDEKLLVRALELKYSEKELEEFFINTVYLGDGVFGVSSAAKHFFGCEYEMIPESKKELFKDIICTYVMDDKYPDSLKNVYEESVLYEENSYIDGVVKETVKRLIDSGVSEDKAYNMIFRGNLHIYTYMDSIAMEIVDNAYDNRETFTSDTLKNRCVQSAMVVMDHEGKIKAIAGGNCEDKVINRAISSNYQIGSTIKPVSTYGLAIENKLVNFSTMIPDEQMYINSSDGTEIRWPSNHDDRYEGMVSVTRALQHSKNTIAVRIGTMLGEEKMYTFLEDKLGYDLVTYHNNNTDKQLSALSLGYLCKGIPLVRLTTSYEMFANGGLFYDYAMVREIKDSAGNIIVQDISEGVRVLSQQTAYIMNRLLYNNVYGEYGIAKAAAIEGVEVLGKTGTTVGETGNDTSKLFVGITSDYIVGVWLGYDDNSPLMSRLYKEPVEIYSDVISRLTHSNRKFDIPEGIIVKEFCELTGELATESCNQKIKGYYTEDNIPGNCSKCKYTK